MKVKIKGPVKKTPGPASFPTLPITSLWLGPDSSRPSPTRHQALSHGHSHPLATALHCWWPDRPGQSPGT